MPAMLLRTRGGEKLESGLRGSFGGEVLCRHGRIVPTAPDVLHTARNAITIVLPARGVSILEVEAHLGLVRDGAVIGGARSTHRSGASTPAHATSIWIDEAKQQLPSPASPSAQPHHLLT